MAQDSRHRNGCQINNAILEGVQMGQSEGAMTSVETQITKPSILFLADHFSYLGGVSHGVTTYYLTVLPALAAAGISVTACFLRETDLGISQLRAKNIETIGLNCSRWSVSSVYKALQVAKRRHYDVIHAAQIKGCLVGRMLGHILNTPVILHHHDAIVPPWPLQLLKRLFARSTDLSLCVSKAVQECAEVGYKVPRDRHHVVYTGLDLSLLQSYSAKRGELRAKLLGVTDARPLLGMVARFFPIKGHRGLIDMMPRILERCPDLLVALVGDGPARQDCEEQARQLGVYDHIRFLGQRDDIPQLVNCFDLLAMPSLSEGLGLAAIEALAAGVPVVGFDVGGVPEVVTHGETGFVVPAGDSAAFTDSVARPVNEPTLRRQMSFAAAEDAGRFSVERHIRALAEVYEGIVVNKAGSTTLAAVESGELGTSAS